MNKGKFIVVEGIDGSGKTTASDFVYKILYERGISAIEMREPGSSRIGESIRNILLSKKNFDMNERTEALLYAASRAQMVENIKKLLDEGTSIICDRYYYSSIAYQGYGREQNIEEITKLNKWAINGVEPDLIIFMDTTPETTALRKQFEKLDRIESESRDFHERVYDGYHMIFEKMDNVCIINEEIRYPEVYKEINNQMNLLFRRE